MYLPARPLLSNPYIRWPFSSHLSPRLLPVRTGHHWLIVCHLDRSSQARIRTPLSSDLAAPATPVALIAGIDILKSFSSPDQSSSRVCFATLSKLSNSSFRFVLLAIVRSNLELFFAKVSSFLEKKAGGGGV